MQPRRNGRARRIQVGAPRMPPRPPAAGGARVRVGRAQDVRNSGWRRQRRGRAPPRPDPRPVVPAAPAPGIDASHQGQTEVHDGRFKWACEHCGGAMCRLLATFGGAVGRAIPLSCCVERMSASFRAPVGPGDTRTCDMCQAVVPARNRWCAGCRYMAEQRRKSRGVIPPSDDWRFEEVIRQVKAEAHRLGRRGAARRGAARACRAAPSTRQLAYIRGAVRHASTRAARRREGTWAARRRQRSREAERGTDGRGGHEGGPALAGRRVPRRQCPRRGHW